jgi:TonB family protein
MKTFVGKSAIEKPVRRTGKRSIMPAVVRMVLVSASLALCSNGCVYFNTFYNAKKAYSEAIEIEKKRQGDNITQKERQLYDLVIEKCSKVLYSHPDSKYVDDALLLMAKSMMKMGEMADAQRKFEQLIMHFPDSPHAVEASYYLGEILLEGEKYVAAEAVLSELASDPKSEFADEALYTLARAHFSAGAPDRAIRSLESLFELCEDCDISVLGHYLLGEIYIDQEKYEEAATEFREVLERVSDPNLAFDTRMRLAVALRRQGQFEEALDLLERLKNDVEEPEKKARVHFEVASTHKESDNLEEAIKVFDAVQTDFPKTEEAAEAAYEMGVIYQEELDRLEEAKEAYDKVKTHKPDKELAEKALRRSSDIAKLISYSEQLQAESAKDLASTQFQLAELYLFDFKHVREAAENYRAVAESYPSSKYAAKALLALGWIYENELGEPDSALSVYRELSRSYWETDQGIEAISILEELGVEVPPPGPSAIAVQETLAVSDAALDSSGLYGPPAPVSMPSEDIPETHDIKPEQAFSISDSVAAPDSFTLRSVEGTASIRFEEEARGDTILPVPLETGEVVYPEMISGPITEGRVEVLALVLPSGRVEETKLIRSMSEEFDVPALRAVENTRFRPGRVGQATLPVWVRAIVEFREEREVPVRAEQDSLSGG